MVWTNNIVLSILLRYLALKGYRKGSPKGEVKSPILVEFWFAEFVQGASEEPKGLTFLARNHRSYLVPSL